MTEIYDQRVLPDIHTERLILRKIVIEDDAEDFLEWYKLPSTTRYMTTTPMTTVEEVKEALHGRLSGPQAISYAVTIPSPSTPAATDEGVTPAPIGDSAGQQRRPHKVIGIVSMRLWPVMGYTFHPSFHRRGYATEALRAFVASLFSIIPPAPLPSDHAPGGAGRHRLQPPPTGAVLRTRLNHLIKGGDGAGAGGDAKAEEPVGYDYLLAMSDVDNVASVKLLERAGFIRGPLIEKEFVNPVSGLRDAVPFFIPRPGTAFGEADIVELCEDMNRQNRELSVMEVWAATR